VLKGLLGIRAIAIAITIVIWVWILVRVLGKTAVGLTKVTRRRRGTASMVVAAATSTIRR
jgi:hypothetical protein